MTASIALGCQSPGTLGRGEGVEQAPIFILYSEQVERQLQREIVKSSKLQTVLQYL